MHWLLFELAAPLASYGGVAPGSVRDTDLLPSRSAVLGLLAAAMGIERDEVQRQQELARDVLIAARVNAAASLLRDYHTAQAPGQAALKGRPCMTRRNELAVPKDDLNTVLSDRYYYADYAATLGVASTDVEKLGHLELALRSPRFTLYLGRKSCPPAWPVDPHRLEAGTWADALIAHDVRAERKLAEFRHFGVEGWLRNHSGRYAHRGDEAVSGDGRIEPGDLGAQVRHVMRRDDPADTGRRLYAERSQWRAEREATS